MVAEHFFINAVEMLSPPAYRRVNFQLVKFLFNQPNSLADINLPFAPFLLDVLDKVIINIGLKVAQAQILQLPFDIRYAQTIGKRRVKLHCLFGDSFTFVLTHEF